MSLDLEEHSQAVWSFGFMSASTGAKARATVRAA